MPADIGAYGVPNWTSTEAMDFRNSLMIDARCGHQQVQIVITVLPRRFRVIEERVDMSRELRTLTTIDCLTRASVDRFVGKSLGEVLGAWRRRLMHEEHGTDFGDPDVGEFVSLTSRNMLMYRAADEGIAVGVHFRYRQLQAAIWPAERGWGRYAEDLRVRLGNEWTGEPGRLFRTYVTLPTAVRTLRDDVSKFSALVDRLVGYVEIRGDDY